MNDETRRQNAKQEYLAQLHRLDAYVRKAADNLPELIAQNNISRVKSTAKRLEIVNGFLSDETLIYLDGPIRKDDIKQLQDERGFIRGVVEVNEGELPEADDAAFDMLAERLYGRLLLADTSFSFVGQRPFGLCPFPFATSCLTSGTDPEPRPPRPAAACADAPTAAHGIPPARGGRPRL